MTIDAEDIIFSLPFPLAVVNTNMEIQEINQKFETLINSSRKYLIGKSLPNCIFSNEVYSQRLESWLRKSQQDIMEVHNLDIGKYRFFLSPFYSSGKEKGTLVLITNKEELTEKNISAFLKGLLHELRNPLAGIKGSAELMLKLKKFDKDLAEVLLREIERVERLINNINKSFDFSGINIKEVNIHKIINKILILLKKEIESKSIEVEKQFDPALPKIAVDEDRITQAFLNVIKNSIDALRENRKKTLVIKSGCSLKLRNFIFISFADTGKGMNSDELENLFTPFYTSKENGTGLGMYITKEIIESHGGKIEVSSKESEGTTVTVFLPIKRLK